MAKIKSNIDITNNVLSTLKQFNSMSETTIKNVETVKKTLSDIGSMDISNVFKESSNIGDSLNKTITILLDSFTTLVSITGLLGGIFPLIKAGLGIMGSVLTKLPIKFMGTGIAAAAASGGILAFASAIWAAMLPLLPYIIAIAGIVIAIQELGKYMGWWKDWGSMIESFSAGIQRLWSAFINNPGVIAFIEQLKNLWNDLLYFISPLTDAIGDWWNSMFPPQSGEFDIVRTIIDGFGALGDTIGWLIGVIAPFATLIFDYLVLPIRLLGSILGPVIGFISSFIGELGKLINGDIDLGEFAQKILGHLVKMIESIVENLWDTISGFAESFINAFSGIGKWIWSGITGAFDYVISSISGFFSDIWSQIVEIFTSTFSDNEIDVISLIISAIFGDGEGEGFKEKANEVLENLFNLDWWIETFTKGIENIANALFEIHPIKLIIDALFGEGTTADLLTSISEFLGGLTELPNKILEFFDKVIQDISTWRENLLSQGKEAGLKLLTGIINEAIKIPTKLWESFVNGLVKLGIISPQMGNKAKEIGTNILNGVIDFVKKVADMVYQEFIRIGSRILEVGGELYNKAKQVGEGIWKSLKKGLGIGSPGHMYWMLHGEWGLIANDMNNQAVLLSESANIIGDAISSAFDPSLGMNIGDVGLPTQTLENPIDYSGAENGFNTINGIITDTTGTINNALANVGLTYDTLTSGIMESTPALEESNLLIIDSFYSLENSVTNALNNIADSNSNNWSNINATTSNHLNNIYLATSNVTSLMNNAWAKMGSSLTNVAGQIRDQSYSKFNSLHKSISSFYNQLSNARFSSGGLGAGPVPSIRKLMSTPVFNKRANSGGPIRNLAAGPSASKDNPSLSGKILNLLDMGRNSHKSRTLLEELLLNIPSNCSNLNGCYFGALDGVVSTNVSKQYNTALPWKIGDPNFLGIKIPMNNVVKDFIGGKPKLSASKFDEILANILSARGFANSSTYSFYFGNKKSNQAVWDSVKCNCMDGEEMIGEIARMLGQNDQGSVRGFWGGIPHRARKINGKIYDMTQFQKRGVFRGSSGVSFGGVGNTGAGSNGIFDSIHNILKNLFELFKPNSGNIILDTSSGQLFNAKTGQTINYGDTKIELKLENRFSIVNNSDKDLDEKKIAEIFSKKQEEFLNSPGFLDQLYKSINEKEARYARYGGV